MKIKLLTLLFLSFGMLVFSQKKRIAFTSFQNPSNASTKYLKALEDKVESIFTATNRFKVIDRIDIKAIVIEQETQKGEKYLDGLTVQQGKLDGAEAIVVGTLNSVDFEKSTTDKGAVSYTSRINFSLKILDVESGEVLVNETITFKLGSWDVFHANDTQDQAFFSALKKGDKEMDKFLEKYFPVTAKIIEIIGKDRNKAKTVLISMGKSKGAKKNKKLKVVEITSMTIDGETTIRKAEIGQIKITDVEGDKISKAKVLKGGDKILRKFNAGAKIECQSMN